MRILLASVLCVCLLDLPQAPSQEWTRFRGPNGTGVSDATTIPTRWTEEDYRWRTELPGVGNSSPVLWGDRVFVTSADPKTGDRYLLCLDADDGRILWQKEFPGSVYTVHQRNTFASSTPTVDDQRLYVVWGAPEKLEVNAFDHDGNVLWSADLGPYSSQHGFASSPIVYRDLVVLCNDQDETSQLVALEKDTGEVRWQVPRKSREAAYSVPCVRTTADGREELIFNSGAHGMTAVDPETGKVNWEIELFDKRSVSSPVMAADVIYGSCGSGQGGNYVVAVRPGDPAGKAAEIAYKIDRSAPYVPTPIANGDLVFLWYDMGVVTCIQAGSGEVVWRRRVGGNFSGSPVRVGDRLYCISDEGDVVVLAAGDKYEVLARNPLGEPSRATPAVARGLMFLRSNSHLAAIGGEDRADGAAGDRDAKGDK